MDDQYTEQLRTALNNLVYRVQTMRDFQKKYFKDRMDYDKKMSIRHEKELDDYVALLRKRGFGTPPPSTEQKSLL